MQPGKNNKFQLMFENHHAVMLLIEPVSGMIIAANKAAENLYGYTKSQFSSLNIEQINCLPSEQIASERHLAAVEQKNYFFFDHRLASGEIRSVEVHSSPIEIDGNLLLFSIVHDVTNRKQTEEALKKIVRAVEQTSVAIEIFDISGTIEYVNPKFCETSGYSLLEILGKPSNIYESDLLTEAEQQTRIANIVTGKEWIGEIQSRRKNGERYWESVSISPIMNEKNVITHFIAIREDITQKKITDDTYRFLAKRSWIPGKVTFINALAVYILETTGLSDILFCKLNPEKTTAQTVVFLHNGVFQDNTSFALSGGPWENLITHQNISYAQNVQNIFPQSALLKKLQSESFLGTPLWGADGETTGFIALLNYKISKNQFIAEEVLKIVASRAAAELERLDAELLLREREIRFRAIFESSKDAICVIQNGVIQICNPVTVSMFGENEEGLIGKAFLDLIASAEHHQVKYFLDTTLYNEDAEASLETIGRRQDESIFDLEIHFSSYLLKDGLYTMLVMRDISLRNKMESALRVSEQRYRDMVEHAVEGIFQSSPTGHFITVNPAMAAIYGYDSPEDMLDSVKNIKRQIYAHSDQRAEFMRLLIQNKYVIEFEAENLRKDGSVFWISCNARIVHDAQGNPQYYEGTVIDITARKQIELETILNQRRLNALLEFSQRDFASQHDLMVFALKLVLQLVDSQSGFIYRYNPSAEQFVLRATFQTGSDLKTPDKTICLDSPSLYNLFKQNTPLRASHFSQLEDKDLACIADFLQLENLVILPMTEKSAPKAFIGIVREKQAFSEQELRQLSLMADAIIQIIERKEAQEQLESSLKEKEALLRELYHRTKNNMQVITAILSMQGSQSEHPAIRQSFKEMERRIHAMSLVHQKLYQAKNLSSIDLDEYIQDLTKQLIEGYDYPIGNIAVKFDLEKIAVLIDTALPLGLVINELLTNSLKYAFPDGRDGQITIHLKQDSTAQIELIIADDGIGLPENIDIKQSARLGIETVIAICELQLHGSVQFINQNGFCCLIRFFDSYYKERV